MIRIKEKKLVWDTVETIFTYSYKGDITEEPLAQKTLASTSGRENKTITSSREKKKTRNCLMFIGYPREQ